ncbi:MAG: hypothetical protein Q4E51_08930 [Lachnospiraceae bacterium]|nr:hypothetical protein [Lachnospiraceae bacterium]
MQNKEYVMIMIDSLKKKRDLLNTLLTKTKNQADLISGNDYDDVNWNQFDVYVEEKDNAIDKIEVLDDGFEQVFNRIREDLDFNKSLYANEIKEMQSLIKELTDIGISIQTAEEKNRRDVERIMTASKKEIKRAKKNLKVSASYISSMYGNNMTPEPSRIDDKK